MESNGSLARGPEQATLGFGSPPILVLSGEVADDAHCAVFPPQRWYCIRRNVQVKDVDLSQRVWHVDGQTGAEWHVDRQTGAVCWRVAGIIEAGKHTGSACTSATGNPAVVSPPLCLHSGDIDYC